MKAFERYGNLLYTRTYNAGLVRDIMLVPELWATVAEEGERPEDFTPDVHREVWLLMADNFTGEATGLFNFHAHNNVTVEIHANMLPVFRKTHAREAGYAALHWYRANLQPQGFCKVIAQIPTYYQNVIDYTKKFGFKEEGINRSSYRRDGMLYDRVLLGMTNIEISETLDVQSS